MKKIIMLILCALMFSGNVYAKNTRYCVALEANRGNKCGKPESMQITVRNQCSVPVYVKFCIEGQDGKGDCGSDSHLKPGKSNGGFWDCRSTGRYEWDSCTGGYKECGFKK